MKMEGIVTFLTLDLLMVHQSLMEPELMESANPSWWMEWAYLSAEPQNNYNTIVYKTNN